MSDEVREWQRVRRAQRDVALTQAGGIVPACVLFAVGMVALSGGGWWWILAAPSLACSALFLWVMFVEVPRECKRAEAADRRTVR